MTQFFLIALIHLAEADGGSFIQYEVIRGPFTEAGCEVEMSKFHAESEDLHRVDAICRNAISPKEFERMEREAI